MTADNDAVVIKGAGSPAEINLMASDMVNLRVVRHARAQCLLMTDTDRGGAFAHLYSTRALLPQQDQQRTVGLVLNKFSGDARLQAPASEMLQTLTAVPTVVVLPMCWQHGLPEIDGVLMLTACSRALLRNGRDCVADACCTSAVGEIHLSI